ncbi:urease accessory protein UreD [Halomonas sp. TRM85114]|uniref:urease accessory protein UreD n=1 Tax=Halomonas jincaotanensis TaxID=2810616 RepID=UPI001BD22953|nr:urease accessory protein UreD [Halomonas jincaotanensis]MBS9404193.1 urease accessory protein UreD [Halomonas jincaotanensis]
MTAFTPPPAAMHSPASGHRFDAKRHWAASIELDFGVRDGVTRLVRSRHQGPLRVQRTFHPEAKNPEDKSGPCHAYLLHPPGGLVSGDALSIHASAGPGAHALLTTPAANRLYKADAHGVAWSQQTRLEVADGGVLEWLPQETLAFDGSRGRQQTSIDLEGSARCLGWEIMALGRPASDLPFATGRIDQHFRLCRDGKPLWVERQPLDPLHSRFSGRWGQGGATVQATLWAVGLDDEPAAIEALRATVTASIRWAVTVRQGVLLLRYLGHERNEAWALCQRAWENLRPLLIGRDAHVPRIWLT